jgi:transcriptional regulator with PAS, ATPase and Fis domain
VRVIAATNRPLEDDIKEAKFRSDLFYRLNVVSFHIPPLRERREDISSLIDYFTANFRNRFSRPNLEISDSARLELENHDWRGNVRELKNTLERAVVFSATDSVDEIYGLENNIVTNNSNPQSVKTDELIPLADLEKHHILRVLCEVNGKREKAADILGITSRTLYRKLKEYKLD